MFWEGRKKYQTRLHMMGQSKDLNSRTFLRTLVCAFDLAHSQADISDFKHLWSVLGKPTEWIYILRDIDASLNKVLILI